MHSIEVPLSLIKGEPVFILNKFGNSGKLRAVYISKPRQVHDSDSHHCNEVSAKGSIRYYPRQWDVSGFS